MSDSDWLKNQLTVIENKIDKMDSRVDNVDVTLAKQSVELENHIYRTQLSEKNIEMLREQVKPIQQKHDMIAGGFKLAGIVSAGCGLIIGAFKVISLLGLL